MFRHRLEQHSVLIAAALLALMLVLLVAAARDDALTVDERPHVVAGYTYLRYQDYRLNPEHPPLLKDLAGLPVLLARPQFPADHPEWTMHPDAWALGSRFLFASGNDAHRLVFLARLPLILLTVAFGAFLFWFVKREFDALAALLALSCYAFSPLILAHGKLVTTDVGGMAFLFVAVAAFVWFLKSDSWLSMAVAGVALGAAQLAKFSAPILVPLFVLVGGVWVVLFSARRRQSVMRIAGVFAISLFVVWAWYGAHTVHMPAEVQDRMLASGLDAGVWRPIGARLADLNDVPGMKPLAHYLLGVGIVQLHVQEGHFHYFLGEFGSQGHWAFFPVGFLLKTPLGVLAMIALAAVVLARRPRPRRWRVWVRKHYFELTAACFILLYGAVAVLGNLNIGIRHLAPILPFLFVLVAVQLAWLVRRAHRAVGFAVLALVIWSAVSVVAEHPSYIPYFNEVGDALEANPRYLSDSDVDWGQDLLRLHEYVVAHPEIDRIGVDYYGLHDARYEFCVANTECGRFHTWHAYDGEYPGTYLAVSQTYLVRDRLERVERGDHGYAYLENRTPIERIGNSIYVYKLG